MEARLVKIARCMEEINRCLAEEIPGQMGGAFLGELDWLEALHYELYESEEVNEQD